MNQPFAIRPDTAQATVATMIEESLAEYHGAVARALPGAEWHEDDRVFWMASKLPFDFYNGVFRSQLSAADADNVIDEVKAAFEAMHVPFIWQLGPSATPADLDQLLIQHGLVHDETEPGMAIDLTTMNEDLPVAVHADIKIARTEADIDEWVNTWAYGSPDWFLAVCKSIHGALPLSDERPWQYFIASVDGRPVATTLLYCGTRAAVVHWVATLSSMRRQGIGAAITLAALREARLRGYHTAALTASEDGAPIYERMGFREYCKIHKYKGNVGK